ncbi:MAG: hypothetical protein ACOCYE_07945, partial [Pseudomonadota bacterium]
GFWPPDPRLTAEPSALAGDGNAIARGARGTVEYPRSFRIRRCTRGTIGVASGGRRSDLADGIDDPAAFVFDAVETEWHYACAFESYPATIARAVNSRICSRC